jgi:predicted lipoprotein with Yx(FWY)xxD motif
MTITLRHSVTAAVAIGVAALALAACGGGDNNRNATAADADVGSGIASIRSVDGTDVLVDSQGRTLYSAEVEERGGIRCTGPCTSVWDPVGASAKQSDSASEDLNLELGVVKRPDGDRQLTYNGLPLYTFTEERPGQLDGDGFVDDFDGTHFEWAAATTDARSGSADSDAPSDGNPNRSYGSPY